MADLTFSLCAATDATVEGTETYNVAITAPKIKSCPMPETLARIRINGANDPTTNHNVVGLQTGFGSNGTTTTWTDQGLVTYTVSGGVATNTNGKLSDRTHSDNRIPVRENGFIEFVLPNPLNSPNQLDIGLQHHIYVGEAFLFDFNSLQGGAGAGWRTTGVMPGYVGVSDGLDPAGSTPWALDEASGDVYRVARQGCDMKWYRNGTEVRNMTRATKTINGLVDNDNVTTEITEPGATLTLEKTVINNDGGTAVDTAWTLEATDGTTTISGIEGATAVTAAALAPGTYTLSESGVQPIPIHQTA